MQGFDQVLVQLKQRLAAGADDQLWIARPSDPETRDLIGQSLGRQEFSPAIAIGANEVGVTEGADGLRPVLVATAPQIASREPQEDGGSPGLAAFSLDGQEGFLDRIGH